MNGRLLELTTGLNADAMQEQIGTFPLDALPLGMQRLIMDVVRQQSFPLDFLAVSMLSAAATAIGNSHQIRIIGNWVASPVMYLVLVGNPGIGKTPPLDFAYRPIQETDNVNFHRFKQAYREYEQSKGNKDCSLERERPVLVRSLLFDFTPEAMVRAHDANPRGITLYVDELMGMFASANRYANGQFTEQLLSAHSGKSFDMLRCGEPIPFHIDKPCINIVGTTQTFRIPELINFGFRENGMLDRLLFAYTANRTIQPWKRNPVITDNPEKVWGNIIQRLASLPCMVDDISHRVVSTILEMTDEATDYFINWRNSMVEGINNHHEDAVVCDTRFAKDPLHVARFALILQLVGWAFGEAGKTHVEIDSIRAAIRINGYFSDCYHELDGIIKTQSLGCDQRSWYCVLHEHFTTADAVSAGMQENISESSVKRGLRRMLESGIIKRTGHGEYSKMS